MRGSPVIHPTDSDVEEGFGVIPNGFCIDQALNSPIKSKLPPTEFEMDEYFLRNVQPSLTQLSPTVLPPSPNGSAIGLEEDLNVQVHVAEPKPLPWKSHQTLSSLWGQLSFATSSSGAYHDPEEAVTPKAMISKDNSSTPSNTRRLYSTHSLAEEDSSSKPSGESDSAKFERGSNKGTVSGGTTINNKAITISPRNFSGFLSNLKPYFFEGEDDMIDDEEVDHGMSHLREGIGGPQDGGGKLKIRSRHQSSQQGDYHLVSTIGTGTTSIVATASSSRSTTGKSLSSGHDHQYFYYAAVFDFDDFESKLMSNIHYGPLIILTAIHLRLIFNENTFIMDNVGVEHQICIGFFVTLTIISLFTLLFSFYLRDIFHWRTFSRQAMENIVIFVMSLCFSLLLIILTIDDYLLFQRLSSSPSQTTAIDVTSTSSFNSLSFHYEVVFYVMMLPFLLNISLSRVTSVINYTSWMMVFASVIVSLSLVKPLVQNIQTLSYFIAVIVVSLIILICKRKSKAAMVKVYRQVEEMKALHNKLSDDLMTMQRELKEQRHLLANTAHDLKMVSF